MDDVEVLLSTTLFQDLTPAELGSLLPAVRRHRLDRGAYFYRIGEASVRAWVLISGQAKMTMLTPDGDETVLDVMLPGELFGLPGLFSTTTHRVGESMATEASVALSIERDALLAFLDHHPAAMHRTLMRLADLVREYAEAMMLSAHDDLRGRLARRLLDLADLHGEQDPRGVRIGARVPQETLGAMIGASRGKVNRALTELAADGLISLNAGIITMLDVDRLRREHPDWFTATDRPPVSAEPDSGVPQGTDTGATVLHDRVAAAHLGGNVMSSAIRPQDIAGLTSQFGGELLGPADDSYGEHRRVWNGMIDRRPAFIARCHSETDVMAAVNFARQQGLLLAVRGGGHSFAGFSTCDDGLVLDLSPMQSVEVDPDRRVAHAQGGVTWSVFDAATQAHGLASTGGLVSTTGIAGLTLGGGIGWLQRKCGLACDNLLSVEMVTAAGDTVRASEAENPELFWGLRGGGGNFGVVTSFEFRLHPVSEVVGGLMLFEASRAAEVMRFYRDYVRDCPDELTTWLSAITAPAADFVPADLQGNAALAVLACHCGDPGSAELALQPLRDLGPTVDLIESMPYPALQSMFDEDLPPGVRCYLKAGYTAELTDPLIAAIVEHTAAMPSASSTFDFHHMGGAVGRVADDATAFGDRRSAFCFNIVGVWHEAVDDGINRAWVRAFASALEPFGTGGVYVNFTAEPGAVEASYGDKKYARLRALKVEYDPGNLFRLNQNIPG